jgi:HprK-related kinase A
LTGALDPTLPVLVANRGVQVAIGPFLVRVRSELDGVTDYLRTFYNGFPFAESEDAHFDLAVVGGRGPRRWFRSQAIAVINGQRPFFPLPASVAGAVFEWGLNWAVGRYAQRWVVLHAAVVERGGRAMILPAAPGSGKSTFAAALGYAGWRFLSDEFALVDPATGEVWPISLKDQSIEVIARWRPGVVFGPEGMDVNGARFRHARPTDESIRRAAEPARPAWVVVPRWLAGRPTSIEPLAKARALVRMADQSFNYNYLGSHGFRVLDDLVRAADCYTLEYSDLDDAVARIEAMTEGPRAQG